MKLPKLFLAWLAPALVAFSTFAQGTAFTYQGRLNTNGAATSGTYNLTFTLFSASNNGVVLAGPVTNLVPVASNGLSPPLTLARECLPGTAIGWKWGFGPMERALSRP